ncbi:hypothetical protein DM39_6981 [Burkholderia cenocepacia]|uniref:Uncharacterized protein n=1 Tax=Burkholderia cenocepacia TaxID=95486 RepID=A0AAN0RN99_9BURK|nr:hypothetical protein DM39_6981 [Burkholderia cenocepacia]
MQTAPAFAGSMPRRPGAARVVRPDLPAHAVGARACTGALSLRAIPCSIEPSPTAATLRADAAPRGARPGHRRTPCRLFCRRPPRAPAQPRLRPSVLLATRARAHVRVQFRSGATPNCVLDARGRFAILNAVEVMQRAPRSTHVHGVGRGRPPCRRALRDCVSAARAPPRRIGMSPFDPPSPTGARPPCPHFAISVTPGRPSRAQP